MFWPPAAGDQAPPHERHVGQPPDRRQLADRVDQDDRRRAAAALAAGALPARLRRTHRLPVPLEPGGHARRTARRAAGPGSAAGRDAGAGPRGRPPAPRPLRLPSCCRPRRPGRTGERPSSLPQLARLGVVPVALQAVVLDRAGDADPLARGRPGRRTARHSRRSGRPRRRCSRSVGPSGPAEAAVAAVAAGAEPGVDDRHLGPGRFAARIRFGQSSSSTRASTVGRIAADRPPRRPAEVERGVERDQVGKGPAGHGQAGRRGRRDDDLPARPPPGHLADQRPQQQDLADAHRVEPEAGLVADPQRGVAPELLRTTPRDTCPSGSCGRASSGSRRSARRRSRSDSERRASRGILSRTGDPVVLSAETPDLLATDVPQRRCQGRPCRRCDGPRRVGRRWPRAVPARRSSCARPTCSGLT